MMSKLRLSKTSQEPNCTPSSYNGRSPQKHANWYLANFTEEKKRPIVLRRIYDNLHPLAKHLILNVTKVNALPKCLLDQPVTSSACRISGPAVSNMIS